MPENSLDVNPTENPHIIVKNETRVTKPKNEDDQLADRLNAMEH